MHPTLLKGGLTMQFTTSLPDEGDGDKRYSVLAPDGGLSDTISKFLSGKSTFIDLMVFRDRTQLSVRLVIDPDDMRQKKNSDTVFIVWSVGILLDQDSFMTATTVFVYGEITTEVVSEGLTAGTLTIWKQHPQSYGTGAA